MKRKEKKSERDLVTSESRPAPSFPSIQCEIKITKKMDENDSTPKDPIEHRQMVKKKKMNKKNFAGEKDEKIK